MNFSIFQRRVITYFSTALDVFSMFDVVSFAAFCNLYKEQFVL